MRHASIALAIALAAGTSAGPAMAMQFAAHNEVTGSYDGDGHCSVTVHWTGGGSSTRNYGVGGTACKALMLVTAFAVGDSDGLRFVPN